MFVGALYRPLHPKTWKLANQAEIEIGLFSRQCLGKRRIGDITILRRQAKAWNRRVNRDQITIKWKFTRKIARLKLNYSFTRPRTRDGRGNGDLRGVLCRRAVRQRRRGW
jgi:hypothetical protein